MAIENEKKHQSLINFGFVLAGVLVAYIASVLFETLAATFGAVQRLRSNDILQQGLPVGLGILTFLILFLNPKVQAWAEEVITEVGKVVWPSRKDTTAMTMVCCAMCVFAGVGFGIFDFFASQLIKVFVN